MRKSKVAPMLDCPECGVALIPAITRGRNNQEGDFIEHGESCRCRWCDWSWMDDQEATCQCGAFVRVHIDDDHAYLRSHKVSAHGSAQAEKP